MADDSSEPDKVYYSSSLSRRDALALSGTGLTTALAGCSGLFDGSTSNRSQPESGTGPTDTTENNLNKPQNRFRSLDIGEESVTFDFRGGEEIVGDFGEEETTEYSLRIYSSPLFGDSRTQIKETAIQVGYYFQEYTTTYDFSEELRNYAQQLTFTAEPKQSDRGEYDLYTTEEVLLPYYNQALDEIVVDVVGLPTATDTQFSDEFEPLAKTRVWFREPEDDYFNKPSPPEDVYPTHWYGEYTDLIITMVVRYPVYEEMVEYSGKMVPRLDWAVFNFDISDIEMVEARRWNSWLVQQIERGRFELSDDGTEAQSPVFDATYDSHDSLGGLLTRGDFHLGDASESPTPFSEYYRSRYGDATTSPDNANINPIMFAGGRPVMKRWAIEIEDKLSNNPNFQAHSDEEYYKATILKAMIGSVPYEFTFNRYADAPEELINNWYQRQGDGEALGGDCVSASAMFQGIGVHLFDTSVCHISMDGDGVAHAQAGLLGLDVPDYLPERVHSRFAIEPIQSGDRMFDSRFGRFVPVECNYPQAVIGYVQRVSAGDYTLTPQSFAASIDINSHIPINGDYEPDVDGEIAADREPAENAFYYQHTVTDPYPYPFFEQVAEKEDEES